MVENNEELDKLKLYHDISSSNFIKHLKSVHKTALSSNKTPSTTSESVTKHFCKKDLYNLKDPHQLRIDSAVVEFFNSCVTVPTYLVEDKSFRKMIKTACMQWNEMGRQKLRQITDQEVDRWRSKVNLLLAANKGFISVETDLWSDRRLRPYITLFGSIVDPSFKRIRILIGFGEVVGAHTGINIRSHFESFLEQAGLTMHDALSTTENARNMVKCFQQQLDGSKIANVEHLLSVSFEGMDMAKIEMLRLEDSDDENEELSSEVRGHEYFTLLDNLADELEAVVIGKRLSCFAHTIQLVVVDALKEMWNDIRHAVSKANNLASVSHQCQLVMQIVGNLPTPVKTRWNYQLRTVRAVLRVSPAKVTEALRAAPRSSRNFNLTAGDRALLDEFCLVMQMQPTTCNLIPA